MLSEQQQEREIPGTDEEAIEWQYELDSALADIDSRLSRPRRSSTTADEQRRPPVELSPEMLDELASRVAQRLRSARATDGMNAPVAVTLPPTHPWPELRGPEVRAPLLQLAPVRENAVLVIRFRWPRLPWPFNRRKRRRWHYVTGAAA